jgi:hypothetical protein
MTTVVDLWLMVICVLNSSHTSWMPVRGVDQYNTTLFTFDEGPLTWSH